MAEASPTIRRRELGARLRALRTAAGMTVEDVAARMDVSPTKISRIETAARGVNINDIRVLCDVLGVAQEERDGLLALARESRRRSWWQAYGLPEGLTTYVGLEDAAVAISEYESGTVPSLLQTEAYARAVIEGSLPDLEPEVVEVRVKARLTRQSRVMGEQPVELWAVLDEGALHRTVGGTEVMREQLHTLTARAAMPHITVQVIPFEAGAHPGLNSCFIMLQLADTVSDVVYVEGLLGNHYLQSPADLTRYRRVFDQLRAIALSPRESLIRTARIADGYAPTTGPTRQKE